MNYRMTYNGVPVMDLQLDVSLYGVRVLGFETLRRDLLPECLALPDTAEAHVQAWLSLRAMDMYPPQGTDGRLDRRMRERLRVPQDAYGRMDCFREFVAMLDNFDLGDGLRVFPEKAEYFYFGFLEPDIIELFRLLPEEGSVKNKDGVL